MSGIKVYPQKDRSAACGCVLQSRDELGHNPRRYPRIVRTRQTKQCRILDTICNVVVGAHWVQPLEIFGPRYVAKFWDIAGAVWSELEAQQIGDADIINGCREQLRVLHDRISSGDSSTAGAANRQPG